MQQPMLQPVEQAVKIILRMHNHWAIPFHLHSHRLSDQTSHRLSPPPPQPQPQPPAFRPPPVRPPANRTPPPMPPPFTPLPSSAVGTQSVQPPPPPVRPYRPPRYSSPPETLSTETLVAASTTTASRLFRFIPTPGFRPHTSANNSSNKM